jgi:myo-inositol-1(or 4)-monophosphatase
MDSETERERSDARRRAAARQVAAAGAGVAMRSFRTDLAVETKTEDRTDVVTAADREAQERALAVLERLYPGEPVVAEEDDARKDLPASGPAWLVDPIDGTNNFAHGNRAWSTAVAAVRDGEPVAAATAMPALGDTYASGPAGTTLNGGPAGVSEEGDPEGCQVALLAYWGRGQREDLVDLVRGVGERFGDLRRVGSAQATLAMVATGQLEAAVTNVTMHPWDAVGGVHMVRRAGGTVTDPTGERWTPDADGLVASNGAIHGDLVDAVR